MRKEEHLKIIKKFEDTVAKMQIRINELKIESTKFEFDAKLHVFISDQRREMIAEMMEKGLKNMNYMTQYDTKVKNFQKEAMDRITLDDEKFGMLKDFIRNSFPKTIMEQKNIPIIPPKSNNKELSRTFVGEGGEIYTPQHVVDIAILIMKKQNEKLKEIFGDTDFDLGSDED